MTTSRQDLTLTWLLGALLSRPLLVFGVPAGLALAGAALSFAVRVEFTSRAAFVPETRGTPALNPALLGLASQFGVTLGGQTAQSPQFYAEVLRSREVLQSVLQTTFSRPDAPGDSASLLDILRIRGKSLPRRLETGLKALDERLDINVDARTSIVQFAVEAPGPQLARDVAARFLNLLSEFNLSRRQSQARERRVFAEQRLAAADSSLVAAENRIRGFYETNRLWQNSPALTFEEARLRRELSLRQELQLMLSREVETDRIEEVNDTPVLTVIDRPAVPDRKSKPRRGLIIAFATILGIALGSAGALAWQTVEDLRAEGHPDYEFLVRVLSRFPRRRHLPARSSKPM